MEIVSVLVRRSSRSSVIYKIIPVGGTYELYLFPEMEADCSRSFFV